MRTNYQGIFSPQVVADLAATRDSGAAIAALNDGTNDGGSSRGGSLIVPALLLALLLAAA